MKVIFLFVFFGLISGCGEKEKKKQAKKEPQVAVNAISQVKVAPHYDSIIQQLKGRRRTIKVTYAAIQCGCAQWVDDKQSKVRPLNLLERFYLEPLSDSLLNANRIWDGETMPFTLSLTGKFSEDRTLPLTSFSKDSLPEKARIFWYEKITVLTPTKK